jgi:Protein of unknown function (DUF402)
MTAIFEAGELIYARHFQRDAVAGIFPLRVARHDAEGLLLWADAHSPAWYTIMSDGRWMRQAPLAEWATAAKVPHRGSFAHSLLSWHPVGADYSIRFFWYDGVFTAWYANLEVPCVPWRRAGVAGTDTVDWDLDIWVEPDRTWRWKDEDEFVARLAEPEHYWVDDEARVRTAGAEVVKLIEAGAFPFDGTWLDFKPDPAWEPLPVDVPAELWELPRAC